MQPVTINIPDHTKGDTWEGLSIGPVTFDSAPPPSNLVSCRMYLRDRRGNLVLKFRTSPAAGEKTITVSDAATWEILVPSVVIDINPSDYSWGFETTDAAGAVRTLYAGVWTITKEHTYDD